MPPAHAITPHTASAADSQPRPGLAKRSSSNAAFPSYLLASAVNRSNAAAPTERPAAWRETAPRFAL